MAPTGIPSFPSDSHILNSDDRVEVGLFNVNLNLIYSPNMTSNLEFAVKPSRSKSSTPNFCKDEEGQL